MYQNFSKLTQQKPVFFHSHNQTIWSDHSVGTSVHLVLLLLLFMEDNCLKILCWFLLYSNMNEP